MSKLEKIGQATIDTYERKIASLENALREAHDEMRHMAHVDVTIGGVADISGKEDVTAINIDQMKGSIRVTYRGQFYECEGKMVVGHE